MADDKAQPPAQEAEVAKSPEAEEDGEIQESEQPTSEAPANASDDAAPPLPDEEPPPLPEEPTPNDDGWQPLWDNEKQAWYFYNRFSGKSQWENPRVPDATSSSAALTSDAAPSAAAKPSTTSAAGGYNPAVHGDYDPNADYAQEGKDNEDPEADLPNITDPSQMYGSTGSFNRFTGKWQTAEAGPERHSDAEKARRQMRAVFDVDAAANSHNGRSLKEERRNRKLTKDQVKAFNDKRRAKKEEKRRAWLKD
jgi:hypothetical protein